MVGTVPEPLSAFAYLSVPAVPFSDRDLSDLLIAARHANAARRVTGKLVVLERPTGAGLEVVRFAQYLEGPTLELAAIVERVLTDPRHGGFEVQRQGPVRLRRFAGWDMAVQPADATTFLQRAAAVAG